MRAAVAAGLFATASGGCLGPALFPCGEHSECDRFAYGRCNGGYCSYPDDECPSGFAYDELASGSLAGQCVPGAQGSSGSATSGESTAVSEASTGDGSTTSDTTAETTATTATTGGCEPELPSCLDRDGDGFGQGRCNGPDCDDDNFGRNEGCFYIAPAPFGDDDNPGTREAPWATFEHAVPQLSDASFSLVLLDGTYDLGTTGLPNIDCSAAPKNEGPTDGISIRAENDGGAYLVSDGSVAAVRVDGCQSVAVSGLAGRADDFEGGADAVVAVTGSSGVKLRRMVFSHANRFTDSAVYSITDSSDVLVEDVEAYYFHRHGIRLGGSAAADIVVRRAYANSVSHDDLPEAVVGRFETDPQDVGDVGFAIEGTNHRLENVLSDEAVGVGIDLGQSQFVTVEGAIVYRARSGIDARSTPGAPSLGHVLRDVVVLRSSMRQITLRSVGDVELDAITLMIGGDAGLWIDELAGAVPVSCTKLPDGCAVTARHVLSLDHSGAGVYGDASPWTLRHANAFGNSTEPETVPNYDVDEPFDDDEGHVQLSSSEAATGMGLGDGECAVFVPPESSMAGRGEAGADIGANVLYRIENGNRTEVPLWDPIEGAFPCGAVVPGVNDVGGRCSDVHTRINGNGCALPSGYGCE